MKKNRNYDTCYGRGTSKKILVKKITFNVFVVFVWLGVYECVCMYEVVGFLYDIFQISLALVILPQRD